VSKAKPYIVWFRQDLRVTDNPALVAAVDSGNPVHPVFILDDTDAGEWRMGAASRWWLHESLNALNRSLGGRLRCHVGNARDVLPQLAADVGAEGITWNRCYEPWRIARDRDIEEKLTSQGVDVLGLIPGIPWYEEMAECWQPGEDGAHARLQQFLESGIQRYKEGRKFDPAGDYVRKYIPELARLPTQYLHSPWEAPTDELDAAGVKLGTNYPQPIVDLKATRARALEAFSSLSAS